MTQNLYTLSISKLLGVVNHVFPVIPPLQKCQSSNVRVHILASVMGINWDQTLRGHTHVPFTE